MWYNEPWIVTPVTVLSGTAMAYFISWLMRGKQRVENAQKEELLQSELRAAKLQAEIDTQNREAAEQRRLDILKTEQRAAQEVTLAAINVIAQKQVEQAQVQSQQGLVIDKTHDLTNSSKTAMEKIEASLRSEVKSLEVAASTDKAAHAAMLQTTKDLAAKDLAAKEAQIAELTRKLADLAAVAVPALAAAVTPIPVSMVAETPVPVSVVAEAPPPATPAR